MAHPVILEAHAWAWLARWRRRVGRPITLGEVPDAALDELAMPGVDLAWLMGVWARSPYARRHALGRMADWRRVLPDVRPEDVTGSAYAVHAYVVDEHLGGDAALAALRERLARRGVGLLLDFVPNHFARDHAWVRAHPERLVRGTAADLAARPTDFFEAGGAVFAHGKDPNFPGWIDTVQVDWRRPEARAAMLAELRSVADRCDGVRCDMAMLLLPEVFERTWGPAWEGPPFWPEATAAVRRRRPGFLFVAEVYWDLEARLVAEGFDHAYDKVVYDRLRARDAAGLRAWLERAGALLPHLLHFVENHDEDRAAAAFGPNAAAAAAVALTLPGARLLHDGQREGARVKLPVQLGRRPREPVDRALAAAHDALVRVLRHPALREGEWSLVEPGPAWDGNPTHAALAAHAWTHPAGRFLVVANLAPHRAQAFLPLPWDDLAGPDGHRRWWLHDRLGAGALYREGAELARRGLYVDLHAGQAHAFELVPERRA